MKTKKTIDGSKFWNPYEGLGVAADLIKLTYNWVQDGVVKASPDSDINPVQGLRSLEIRVRELRPKVKFAVQEWIFVRVGQKSEATPVQIKPAELEVLHAVQHQIERIEQMIADSAGGLRMDNLAIEYPTAEIQFSTNDYFNFVRRSIGELIGMARVGKVAGPSLDQVF